MANLGFIGVGIMGKPMAGHLMAASHTLHICDINPEPVKELAVKGAVACSNGKEVAEKSEIVWINLFWNKWYNIPNFIKNVRRKQWNAENFLPKV